MAQLNKFICEGCGKETISQGKYVCSLECRSKIFVGKRATAYGRKLSVEQKEVIRQDMLKQYASGKRVPYQLGKPQYKVRGKNHWAWKNGASGKDQTLRCRVEFRVWRRQVFAQQENKCANCGETNIKLLVAHHIKYFKDYPELAYDPNNGMILCRRCHPKIHRLKK